jgi:hypothetical protein
LKWSFIGIFVPLVLYFGYQVVTDSATPHILRELISRVQERSYLGKRGDKTNTELTLSFGNDDADESAKEDDEDTKKSTKGVKED